MTPVRFGVISLCVVCFCLEITQIVDKATKAGTHVSSGVRTRVSIEH